jgi:hypothetical protein
MSAFDAVDALPPAHECHEYGCCYRLSNNILLRCIGRDWPKADITFCTANVRSRGKANKASKAGVRERETVEHPFGTIKARMGATHLQMKTLPRVASEMALHVLAYNMTRVMSIMGVRPLMAAMRA